MELNKIYNEDCLEGLKKLPDNSIDCCITSPPYFGLRDYGNDNQIGLEETPEEYVAKLVDVFSEVKRVLKAEGTLWLNLGDSYIAKPKSNYDGKGKSLNDKAYGTGDTTLGYKQSADKFKALLGAGNYKNKDLIGIPFMVAFALRADGWYLRQDIIWHKLNPMPEPVKDRCVKSHEYIFLLSKSEKYYFDYKSIQEEATSVDDLEKRIRGGKELWKTQKAQTTYSMSGVGRDRREMYSKSEDGTYKRNKRDVWTINLKPDLSAHFAVFPEDLIKPCILAGCPRDGVVLDPFMGSGTTARMATMMNRNYIGFELNPEYVMIGQNKAMVTPDFFY